MTGPNNILLGAIVQGLSITIAWPKDNLYHILHLNSTEI